LLLNFASSANLAHQIENGARADIYISADPQWTTYLKQTNFIADSTALASNELVIIVPSNDSKQWHPASINDLADSKLEHIAIGDPVSVPAGKYAKHALQKAGLWEDVKPKLTLAPDCRAAFVQTNQALTDAGIVYSTDVPEQADVKIVDRLGHELTGDIKYTVALTNRGAESETAKEFYQFLIGQTAQAIFKNHGFLVKGIDSQDRQ
jgi:molybdate transport system substrate-binding protein